MDFDFSQEQYMFQDATRSFLQENGAPDRRDAANDGVDETFWSKLADTGCFSMLAPEEFGGMGLSFVDLALVLEEYGRALVPPPVAETIAATDVVARFATPEQKGKLLPALVAGALKIAPAILEPDAGYDPSDVMTLATPSGNGWRLSGAKILAPRADIADLIMLSVRFGDDGPLGLVLIEKGRDGVALAAHDTLDLSALYHRIDLCDVMIVRDDVVGGEPTPASVDRLLDAGAAIAASMMTGIAGKVLDDAVAYAAQRTQFGKPIGSFQAIKHRCADMAVAIDASRSAAYYAAWALAEQSADCAKAVSMAKSYCGDAARFVCNEGVQIHGGVGFTWELGVHRYLRRAKMLEYSYGDAAFHRERVVSCALTEMGVAR